MCVRCQAQETLAGIKLVFVPAGPFLMGSDKARDSLAFDGDETPQHEVMLPGYWIGKTPVTVAQFQSFVRESGYRWKGARSEQGGDDHPVVYVTWHDALAYCEWLAQRTGLLVTLPSEAEWEKAARGTDGRIYPWGDEPPDARRCNFNDNVGTTTPVGAYSSQGDSPYGCVDMAGNVWEWTRSLWGKEPFTPEFRYPYQPGGGRENLRAGDEVRRVLRGGAFVSGASNVRAAYRLDSLLSLPDPRSDWFGFRLCVVSPVSL